MGNKKIARIVHRSQITRYWNSKICKNTLNQAKFNTLVDLNQEYIDSKDRAKISQSKMSLIRAGKFFKAQNRDVIYI